MSTWAGTGGLEFIVASSAKGKDGLVFWRGHVLDLSLAKG